MKCRNKGCDNEAHTDDNGSWRQCAACMQATARNAHAAFMRKRAIRKETKKVRGRLAYLTELAQTDPKGYGRGFEALADRGRIDRIEAKIAECERELKIARREVRDNIARNWTKAEIDAACVRVAEATIAARTAAREASSNDG